MDEDAEVVLACTADKITYLIAVLDREGVGDAPRPRFCPFCGKEHPVTEEILAPIERELRLIKGGKD
jgi:hypothetical protein